MVLGYTDYCFVGLFSDKEKASEVGCVEFREVEPEFVQEDSTVFALKVTIETYFGQDIEMIYIGKSMDDNINDMSEVVSKKNLQDVCKYFVDSLPEEDREMILSSNGEIPLDDFIANINLALLELEPDEIVD